MTAQPLRRAAVAAGVLVLTSALGATSAHAARPRPSQPQYVALGDSYAAGDGAGSYLADGTSCYRSLAGYPGLIAQSSGYALNLQACSGATTADVQSLQLGTLTSKTAKVTITVGGNDVGFSSTLSTCLGSDTAACLAKVAEAKAVMDGQLPGRLDALFGAVRAKAPNATVTVTTYPRLFNGTDCSWLTDFTALEMTELNAGADQLADVLAAAAGRAGFRFADVRTPFVGHAVCDASAWIRNAQLFSQFESYHPTATGYSSGYAPMVRSVMSATSSGSTMSVTTGGETSTDTRRGTVRVR